MDELYSDTFLQHTQQRQQGMLAKEVFYHQIHSTAMTHYCLEQSLEEKEDDELDVSHLKDKNCTIIHKNVSKFYSQNIGRITKCDNNLACKQKKYFDA